MTIVAVDMYGRLYCTDVADISEKSAAVNSDIVVIPSKTGNILLVIVGVVSAQNLTKKAANNGEN